MGEIIVDPFEGIEEGGADYGFGGPGTSCWVWLDGHFWTFVRPCSAVLCVDFWRVLSIQERMTFLGVDASLLRQEHLACFGSLSGGHHFTLLLHSNSQSHNTMASNLSHQANYYVVGIHGL